MPPMSFNEPLLLREFFFTMASANPGLHKMVKNPLSVQYPWEENVEGLQRWKQVSFVYICVVGFSADERFVRKKLHAGKGSNWLHLCLAFISGYHGISMD